MGSSLSCKKSKTKPEKLEQFERKTFKQQRTELLITTKLPPDLNIIIYEYSFENKGLLLFKPVQSPSGKTLENISWFDGLGWNLIPFHPLLSEMTDCGICVIKDHIVFLGGSKFSELKNDKFKLELNQTTVYKYNYLDFKFTKLADSPGPMSGYDANCVNLNPYLLVFMKYTYFESTRNNMVYRYDILNNVWEKDSAFEGIKTNNSDKFVVEDKLFINDQTSDILYCYCNLKLHKISINFVESEYPHRYFSNFKNQLCCIYCKYNDEDCVEERIFCEVKSTNFKELIATKKEYTKTPKNFNGHTLYWDNNCCFEFRRNTHAIILIDSNNINHRIDECPKLQDYMSCISMLLI